MKEPQTSKETQIMNEPQIWKERHYKTNPITNEPQNLKDHQISKQTQITNEPQISKEP